MGQLGAHINKILLNNEPIRGFIREDFFVFVLSSDTDRFICSKFVGCSFLNMHAPIIPIAQLEKAFGAL